MSDFTITKTQVECYKITKPRNAWADITVDANGKAGRIQIASDFGSWEYYWGACGCSFKEFLTKLNLDYVASKFGASRWFDHGATMTLLREELAKHLEEREPVYDEFDLEEELDELEGCDDETLFFHFVMQSEVLSRVWEYEGRLQYDIEPGFKQFWHRLWPPFIEALKKEIEQLTAETTKKEHKANFNAYISALSDHVYNRLNQS